MLKYISGLDWKAIVYTGLLIAGLLFLIGGMFVLPIVQGDPNLMSTGEFDLC